MLTKPDNSKSKTLAVLFSLSFESQFRSTFTTTGKRQIEPRDQFSYLNLRDSKLEKVEFAVCRERDFKSLYCFLFHLFSTSKLSPLSV